MQVGVRHGDHVGNRQPVALQGLGQRVVLRSEPFVDLCVADPHPSVEQQHAILVDQGEAENGATFACLRMTFGKRNVREVEREHVDHGATSSSRSSDASSHYVATSWT